MAHIKTPLDERKKIITSFTCPAPVKKRIEDEAKRHDTSQTQIILQALSFYFHSAESGDPWDVEADGWYNPHTFYTLGEDKKGHSVKVTASIPKNLIGEIARVVESGEIPEYQSRTHFVRDAIYHRAKQVAGFLKNGELERQTDLALMLSMEMGIQQQKEETELLIATMRDNCQQAYARGNLEFLDEYLARRRDYQNRIPEEYKDEFVAVLDEYQQKLRQARRDRIKQVQ